MKKEEKTKTKEEILNQPYMSPQDLRILMPTVGMNVCRDYINEVRYEMEQKGYYVPKTTPRIALTKLVRKKLGL
mgnify:CR=1 FL=1